MQHVVLNRREKLYPRRPDANHYRRDDKEHWTADPGGQGTEVVREVPVCLECARRIQAGGG